MAKAKARARKDPPKQRRGRRAAAESAAARLKRQLAEARAQQAATAAILKVIRKSLSDSAPVFDSITRSAAKLCGAPIAAVIRAEAGMLHLTSIQVARAFGPFAKLWPMPIERGGVQATVVRERKLVNVGDVRTDARVAVWARPLYRKLRIRSGLWVPMISKAGVPGLIVVFHSEANAFDARKESLLRTFADQAVIAIENARLFNETKEALERQTATAEILKVIASSPAEVQPVFDAIVQTAKRLIGAFSATVTHVGDGMLHLVAHTATTPQGAEALNRFFPIPVEGTPMGRAIQLRRPEFVDDFETGPGLKDADRDLARSRGFRSVVFVPLMRGNVAIGSLNVTRREAGRMTDHQLDLLKTFADQAVIAIENVRLFNETKEALERQTATSEVLKVIAGSPTDTQPVFDAILRSAVNLCGAEIAAMFPYDGKLVHLGATYNWSPEALRYFATVYPSPPSAELMSGRTILAKSVIRLADAAADAHYDQNSAVSGHWRRMLGVPMLREGQPIGALVVCWREPGDTPQRQVDLLQTFADQAVIAIENVRLFNETKEALERQTATSAILEVIANSRTEVQPVFDAIVQSAARLFGRTATLRLIEPEGLRRRALSEVAETSGQPPELMALNVESLGGRVALEGRPRQVVDTRAPDAPPYARMHSHKWNFRANASAPLMREGKAIGTLNVSSPQPGALSEKQMELLSTFANQAVIAIENVRLFNETKEALERQTATAEILQVIGSSPTDTQPVFDAIVNSGVRLFPGAMITVARPDGGTVRAAAIAHEDATMVTKWRERFTTPLSRDRLHAAAILDAKFIDFPDAEAEKDGPLGPGVRNFLLSGNRAVTIMPMLRGGGAIGAISVTRGVPGPLSDKQIAILRTFADQAVIAIENVRLFNETKEALERQTATAEILKVISSSPSDIQPVFDVIVSSALRLLEGHSAVVTRIEGATEYLGAYTSTGNAGDEAMPARYPRPVTGSAKSQRAVATGTPQIVQDYETDPDVSQSAREHARVRGYRSNLLVPMIREGIVIGAIRVTRKMPGPYPAHQIRLLQTFADQAVIAIENVRLFNETKEALEQQTATADILKVISSSPTDTQPVFEAIVQSGLKLFPNAAIVVTLPDGDRIRLAAIADADPAHEAQWRKRHHFPLTREYMHAVAILDRMVIDVPDAQAYEGGPLAAGIRNFLATGNRAITIMPMQRADAVIGTISVIRLAPGPLTEKQISLLRTFADQAVIAIENVRLFKELQSRTEALTKSVGQLTALGEVGQAISSTLDVETVLETVVSHAVQLTGLDAGVVYEYDPPTGRFELRASQNFDEEGVASLRGANIRTGEGAVGMSVEKREPVQVADTHAPDYPARLRELLDRYGYRALLAVPLLREDNVIGALMMTRKAPGEFAPDVVELLQTFASQSALAIQNARLFREIAEKGKQLEVASRHKSDFLASMSHELRTPLNAILGFNEMIIGQVYGDVPADMQEPLEDIQKSGKHLLRLINNVLDLAKIEAGRMELSLSDYSVHDTVESVRATLRPLAAEKGLEFHASVPADLPLAYGDAGRIAQCLMNLAGNSLKFTKAGKVEISVEPKDALIVFRVADTGIGIPPDKIAVLFTEFKQTDATIASEYGGTGLGLSISKKFVEMHGGRIWVESEIGKGSTFIFEIPLRVNS